jgi:multisubunit Na+/H+ antiporter MnhC subunit
VSPRVEEAVVLAAVVLAFAMGAVLLFAAWWSLW